jgi:hypothetical protein
MIKKQTITYAIEKIDNDNNYKILGIIEDINDIIVRYENENEIKEKIKSLNLKIGEFYKSDIDVFITDNFTNALEIKNNDNYNVIETFIKIELTKLDNDNNYDMKLISSVNKHYENSYLSYKNNQETIDFLKKEIVRIMEIGEKYTYTLHLYEN